jgi:AcrR family transcriptional regulator/DNA-binding XRE family transcriptional regulator
MSTETDGDVGFPTALGTRIRAARLAAGISLRELARRLEISPATLSQMETGKAGVSAARLYELVVVLGTTFEQVLPMVPAPPTPPADRRPTSVGADGLSLVRGGASTRVAGTEPDGAPGEWRRFGPLAWDPVLIAALNAFVAVGYHGATVRDIASRCGLSVPGLYHHYASKEDLLAAILDHTMADLLWRSRAARDSGADPVERFALLIECLALFHTYRREPAFIGASEMRSLASPNRERIAASRVTQQRMIDAEVDAAVAAGSFGNTHPHEAARAAVTMCTALVQWYRPDGPMTPERIATLYVEFALALMLPRGPLGRR